MRQLQRTHSHATANTHPHARTARQPHANSNNHSKWLAHSNAGSEPDANTHSNAYPVSG